MTGLNKTQLTKLKDGDERAFNHFYKSYRNLVYSTIYHIVQSVEDAEEITNDVLMLIRDQLGKYTTDCTFGGWVRTIAKHKAIDHLRSRTLHSGFITTTESGEIPEFTCGGIAMEYDEEEQRKMFMGIFKDLSKFYQEILWLRYEKNLSIDELSDYFDLTKKQIRNALARARYTARQVLKNK